jgi:hypothetical protein
LLKQLKSSAQSNNFESVIQLAKGKLSFGSSADKAYERSGRWPGKNGQQEQEQADWKSVYDNVAQ